ncbi:hypothetical protein M3Y95_00632800 [Aphelenchoides besseyi]|nr:hypothetical protein M3Y95_00632800 [Aphelenchoides besseyi]
MTSKTQLYGRAILLEEYRNGTALEKAVEKVHAELGPKAIDGDDARKCFEAFKGGDEKITEIANISNRRLVENGTFLRSKRSLIAALEVDDCSLGCKIYGANGRFQIVYNNCINYIVKTFDETIRVIRVDGSAVEELNEFDSLIVEIMCFIGPSTVCGVFFCYSIQKRFWFNGSFDEINSILCIHTVKHMKMLYFTLDPHAQPATLTGMSTSGKWCHSYIVDLSNGNLSDVTVTEMQHDIWSPMIRNGKLFGFPYTDDVYQLVNAKKFWEISLVDGSKIEYKIEEKTNIEISIFSSSCWNNDQILVESYDYDNEVSTVYKFDISQMKWEKTTIEVKGRIQAMTVDDGLLIVQADTWQNESSQFYRFQYEAVDSLANLVWLSMRRYSKRNPSFQDWFISKLPKNYKRRLL